MKTLTSKVQSLFNPASSYTFVSNCTTLPDRPHMANLRSLVEDLALARTSKEASHIVILINKAVEALLEGLTPHIGQPVETESLARYRDANLLVLRALADDGLTGKTGPGPGSPLPWLTPGMRSSTTRMLRTA